MGDVKNTDLRVSFDNRVRVKFVGSKVTTDAGLLAYSELGEVLSLTKMGAEVLTDSRLGRNKQHGLVPMLRQSIYSRLAGYEDVNDAERLAVDPAMRLLSLDGRHRRTRKPLPQAELDASRRRHSVPTPTSQR